MNAPLLPVTLWGCTDVGAIWNFMWKVLKGLKCFIYRSLAPSKNELGKINNIVNILYSIQSYNTSIERGIVKWSVSNGIKCIIKS